MTYDYHGAWDGVTGHNSPLYGRKNEPEKDKLWNINSSMHIWMGTFTSLNSIINHLKTLFKL